MAESLKFEVSKTGDSCSGTVFCVCLKEFVDLSYRIAMKSASEKPGGNHTKKRICKQQTSPLGRSTIFADKG